ncbi:YihY/virulence factor BrkB family protein, partial [Arthrobacter deserti]|nr:YihY/virulence factor BrkB family protein [Arthrobacter deserti]
VAAMLVAGFAVFGLVASGTPGLQQAIVALVSESTPGLINTGDGGFATPQQLFAHGPAFGLTLVVSSTILVLTALGWLSGLREGMRGIFGLPALAGNYFLIKLKDAGTLLLLAVALVLTSVLAVVAGSLLDLIAGWLDFDGAVASPLARATGILVMLVLDMVVGVVFFRLASGLRMNRTVMLQAALIAAAGSTVLRFFASALLAGVSRNPLLAPFAVILGLFVWFYFLSQIYLVAAAWGAVGMADVRSRDRIRDARHRATSIRQLSRRRVPGERHSRPRHARPKPAILRE